MADDLLVTDEALEDPLVLKRLLQDIIERLSDDVNGVVTNTFVTQVVSALGGSGSAITIQDNGAVLTTALRKINFVGFNIEEPAPDELKITFNVPAARNEYCPGYNYSKYTDTAFTIDLADASNLFFIGRRIKFTHSNNQISHGVVTAVDYNSTNANDTTVTVTMENSAIVPSGAFEVCLVSSSVSWSPIATDPFSGGAINDICTGSIGTAQWWVAVGNNGKIATSNNAGETWTIRTSNTTKKLNVCAYDKDSERFWVGGNDGVLLSSINGTTFILDATRIPALTSTGTGSINGIDYNSANSAIMVIFQETSTPSWSSAASFDLGLTWTKYAGLGQVEEGVKAFHCVESAGGGTTGPASYSSTKNSTQSLVVTSATDTTFSGGDTFGTGNIASGFAFFGDGANANRMYGFFNGSITGLFGGWNVLDDVTFNAAIRDFAYSNIHARLVCVGDTGIIGYLDEANKATPDAWTGVSNGFLPTADVKAVAFNDSDGIFIAVASNGQICRSSNGIN